MKIIIFGGSGAIGRACAWDLAQSPEVEKIGLVGRRREALAQIQTWVGSPKIEVHPADILDRSEAQKLMRAYDVGIISVPDRKTSYSLIHSAVEIGFSIVDNLEEYHRRPDLYETEGLEVPTGMSLYDYGDWLDAKAKETGATVLDGMGFAPGLSNITVGEGIRKLDRTEKAVARVGGIPSKEAALRHPLRYMITWAFEHVLREYMVRLNVIKNGKVIEVSALTDREKFRFNRFGKEEELECAVTPGMPSFIFTRPELQEFAEKTVRWPGHWEGIDALKEIGFLDLEPVEFQGMKIVPRQFLLHLIRPKLLPKEGETDVCVMWNTVVGVKNGRKTRIDYYMWDEADTKHGLTSMARVTGFPQAIGALFLGQGLITQKGIVAPEDGIYGETYNRFMAELEKRHIRILEEIKEDGA